MLKYAFILVLLSASVSAQAAPPCFKFIGEKFTFSVDWEFINAGSATMMVGESTTGGHSIRVHARTNHFLDLFKKVRDTITSEGVCLGKQVQSTLFQLDQRERTYIAHKKTIFDWQHHRVLYTEHAKTSVYPVPQGHLNVMDAFFKVRSMDLSLGQAIHIPIFDSRKIYDVVIHIGNKTKKIRAPWGERVECISIEPQLKTEGIFSSPGKMKIWVTRDSHHIPLKLVAKIKIGRIIGRLTQYQEPM
ncbi:MAG: DUF3108 domain-containing protein [Mariprofundaceae bacterium]|nr:DUF3108 domain-containing protein [Mariprofundaceae bacterium]